MKMPQRPVSISKRSLAFEEGLMKDPVKPEGPSASDRFEGECQSPYFSRGLHSDPDSAKKSMGRTGSIATRIEPQEPYSHSQSITSEEDELDYVCLEDPADWFPFERQTNKQACERESETSQRLLVEYKKKEVPRSEDVISDLKPSIHQTQATPELSKWETQAIPPMVTPAAVSSMASLTGIPASSKRVEAIRARLMAIANKDFESLLESSKKTKEQ